MFSPKNAASSSVIPTGPQTSAAFWPGYDRVVESAQEMLTYLDQNYTIHPEIKRVILNLCRAHEEELHMNSVTSRLYLDETDLTRMIDSCR